MVSIVDTYTVIGVDGQSVHVETDISPGMPGFQIVGLPGGAIREALERVRAAIKNSGLEFPQRRVTVNLSPASIRKDGAAFDLPIAVGVLAASGVIKKEALKGTFFIGELSLDGVLRPVPGVLPMTAGAVKDGETRVVLPIENAAEAAIVEGISVIPVKTLSAAAEFLRGRFEIEPFRPEPKAGSETRGEAVLDFSDVRGQTAVIRAIEVAAAGGHNVLMLGPPGGGKTMIAKRIPGILPPLDFDESIEVTKIYSVAGLMNGGGAGNAGLITKRPFRSPHHSVSYAALTGGGRVPKPGEISLAHKGVLFLDELPAFQRTVLEMLREPMEDKTVTVSRVGGAVEYPTEFMLVAAMNPCPCGFYPDMEKCKCGRNEVLRYQARLSGPLLDRIDIHIEAPRVKYSEISGAAPETSSAAIRARVLAAREVQRGRLSGRLNSNMTTGEVEKFCRTEERGEKMLKAAFEKFGLSMRSYTKILRTARTIADLAGEEIIDTRSLAEAVGYRALDRKM